MKKRWLLFLSLASVGILLISTTSRPQASRELGKRTKAISKTAATSWSNPVNISNTVFDSESPFLALDDNGKAYVTWVDWTGGYSRNMMFNTNVSGSWGAAKIGAPLIYTAIDDVGFPTIAASPLGGSASVAYHDGDFSRYLMSIFGFEYNNGSLGTSHVITNDAPVACSYVTMAVSPTTKNLFMIFMADVAEGFQLALKYQDANTKAWTAPALISANMAQSNYLPQMCIDAKGTAHVVWITRPAGAVVWYSKNTTPTNPNTWTAPFQISPTTGLDWTYPRVAADADSDAYVVWHDLTTGNSEVFLRKTVNGQWQTAENISQTPLLSETGTVAVHGTTKEIYIAWHERVVEAQNWDVLMRTYEEEYLNGPKKWSAVVNFSNSPSYSGEPCLRATPEGDIHLVYFETVGNNREIMHSYKEEIKVYPPTSLNLATAIDKILFYSEKVNTLTFSMNSQNQADYLDSYKVYRKKVGESDDQFQLLATLNTSTFTYTDKHLSLTQKYVYAVTAVDKGGNESDKAAVTEK